MLLSKCSLPSPNSQGSWALNSHLSTTWYSSDPAGYCLSTQTTESLPVSIPEPLLQEYTFIYQTVMHKVHKQHHTGRGGRSAGWKRQLASAKTKASQQGLQEVLTKINAKCTWDAAVPHRSWRHSLGGPDGWQLQCVSSGCPCSSESKPWHRLHQQEDNQLIEGCDYSSQFGTHQGTPVTLGQGFRLTSRKTLKTWRAKGRQYDEKVVGLHRWNKVEGTGYVQPR